METRTVPGSCLCRRVRFEVTLPSKFCAHCHCSQCRRANGAAFVTWVGFRENQLRVAEGEERLRAFHTETGATRTFCDTCGSSVFFRSPRWEGEVHVALAYIHEPIDRSPQAHVYVDHKAPWFDITDDLPRLGGPDGTTPQKRILVLCTGNRCRSQMAEGWLRHESGGRLDVKSAGTHPKGLHPVAVEVMAEAGVDISRQASHHVADYLAQPFDVVVTVCDSARESCPVFPNAARTLHRSFEDPDAKLTGDAQRALFRRIRDEIRAWAGEFLEELEA